jgi:hypothetical protein
MKKQKPAKKRRLVRGTHFDVWAFRYHDGRFSTMTYNYRPTILDSERREGRWVRVRFVEVKP